MGTARVVPEDERAGDLRASRSTRSGPMAPEDAAALVQKLKEARLKAGRLRAEDTAAVLNDPLAHLNRYRRAEWEVLMRFLAAPDMDQRTLAGILGYKDHRTIQQILKRPHVKAMIDMIRQKQIEAVIRGDFGATAMLKANQTKAAKKIVETIHDPAAPVKTQLAAAESVLDRTGLGKASTMQVHHTHEILRHFTPEEKRAFGDHGTVPERFKTVFAQLEGPKEA